MPVILYAEEADMEYDVPAFWLARVYSTILLLSLLAEESGAVQLRFLLFRNIKSAPIGGGSSASGSSVYTPGGTVGTVS